MLRRLSTLASKRPLTQNWRATPVPQFPQISSVDPLARCMVSCESTVNNIRVSRISRAASVPVSGEIKNYHYIYPCGGELGPPSQRIRSRFPSHHGQLLKCYQFHQARCFVSTPNVHQEPKGLKNTAPNSSSTSSKSFSINDDGDESDSDSDDKNGKDKSKITRRKHSRRFKRRKLQQKAKPGQAEKSQVMSEPVARRQLQNLFDEIAPLVLINKLENFVATLEDSKHAPKELKNIVDKSTKLAASQDAQSSTSEANAQQDPKTWMQSKVLSFLDILPLHARPVKTMPSPAQEHQKTLRQTAAILQKAREKSIQTNDMAWSRAHRPVVTKNNKRKVWHKAKSDKELKDEAHDFARLLSERLPSHKYNLLVRFFDSYVKYQNDNSSAKSDRVPDNNDNGKMTTPPPSVKKGGIRLLFNNVEFKLGGHVHLIAPELARFFYFDPLSDDQLDDKNINESTSRESVAYKELKVIESEKKWQKYRDRFVDKMLAIQQQLHNSPYTPDLQWSDELGHTPLHSSGMPGDDDGKVHDIAHHFSVQDEDEEDDAHLHEEEADIEDEKADEEDLEKMVTGRLRKSKVDKSEEEKDVRSSASPKSRRHVHLIFESVVIDEYRDRDKEYPLTSDTTLFIDNLPIDITEDEVMELYSRCGPLDSVEIFNQRPDLDPGPLSPTKLAKMAQRKRKQRARFRVQHQGSWAKPRTPVYAMLTFGNEESMLSASKDSLRIFGVIVKGHSVRSIRAKDLTRLYIENIGPPASGSGLFRSAMDIEFSLSRLLNPDLYVSLDITSGTHQKSCRVVPGSCEIMFPSFEVAYDAFSKLREGLDMVTEDEECTINWMRTPPDALQYWKRELGGVV